MDCETEPALAFPVVGVGASAGGIEALEGFFAGLRGRPGLAVVLVTHLSPDRESHLPQIVTRFTDMPVHVVEDGMRVQTDAVYVMGPNVVLTIHGGILHLETLRAGHRERKPIDVFFSTLAADQGHAAACVILSGGDSDGTLGAKAVKARGGLTLAQVPDGFGPHQPDMPDNAISAGFIDFALPVDQMGERLAAFAHSIDQPEDRAAGSDAPTPPSLQAASQEIYGILRDRLGHDFAGYKTKTFTRRVQRRMQILQISTSDTYVERLRNEPQEVQALFRDLLISVTAFFRDPGAFDTLAKQVLPRLLERHGASEVVRVWVPGCATGEEVYSLAILIREQMDGLANVPRVQIFATDIDETALTIARAGRYPDTLLEGISDARRKRFFIAEGGMSTVAKEVRDLCIFSPHSVIRDPPFSRIDLISCRNLLIYFSPEVQAQVLPVFHYALREEGYLFLGTSETIGQFGELFMPLDKKHRIFRRRSAAAAGMRVPMRLANLQNGSGDAGGQKRGSFSGLAMRQAVESQVLERHAPPFVVVNREGDITYYSARTGKYLEAAPGLPTRQLMALARKGLRLDLRTALRETAESGRPARRDGVLVEGPEGQVQMLSITVERLREADRDDPLFLVLFEDDGESLEPHAINGNTRVDDGAVAHLEGELRETRERLQSLIEEYETALEELKSSNEELVSVNEELQSANEEMEASKEELQSVNEELHTVNTELNVKVDALDRANADLHNLFESTNVATVFLDADLVIRSFTPAVAKVFRILPGDRGRPITDLATRFTLPDLVPDVATVLADGSSVERRTWSDESETHYLVRISPYLDAAQRTRGVVISFIDVTELNRSEAQQKVLIAELHHRTRNLLTVVQAIATLTLNKGGTLQSFTDRLAALGRVQDLVNQVDGERVELGEIVRLELRAHAVVPDGRVRFGGPPVRLQLDRLQAIALAVHELATNAMKYGALKQEAATLSVHWSILNDADQAPRVVLEWKEAGVVMPPSTMRRGYGRQMIERALAHTLGARSEFNLGPDGVTCRIEVPLGRRPQRVPEQPA